MRWYFYDIFAAILLTKRCEYVNMCNGMAGCRKYKRIDFAYLCKVNFKKDLGA